MAAARNTDTARPKDEAFGLLANGCSGPWEIAVDEHISGADRWSVQIEGPSVSFYFEIPSLETISKMAQFLDRSIPSSETNDLLLISKDQQMPVTLIKDDEYADRFFLVVGPTANPMVRFTIAGKDVTDFLEALRQAIDDTSDAD